MEKQIETVKEEFLKDWEDLMTRVPRTEKVVVGADLNGHVGENPGVFQRVHGGKGYGQKNREGENILESMKSLDLALVNTFFNKKEEHLITYNTHGGNSSQIYFIMTRRETKGNARLQGNTRRGGCISASAAMCSPEDKRSKT